MENEVCLCQLKQQLQCLEKENAELKRQLETRRGDLEEISFKLTDFYSGEKVQYTFQPNDSTGTFWSLRISK